jgi:hypothetical protein
VDGVRTALNTVLTELHKVLYKQLLAWLLQGNLYDPYQVGNFGSFSKYFGSQRVVIVGKLRLYTDIIILQYSIRYRYIDNSVAEPVHFCGAPAQAQGWQ